MNQEKLKQLQAQVRIGGKGTARRKKKVVHRTATTDDKKLQSSLKKLAVSAQERRAIELGILQSMGGVAWNKGASRMALAAATHYKAYFITCIGLFISRTRSK